VKTNDKQREKDKVNARENTKDKIVQHTTTFSVNGQMSIHVKLSNKGF
jgi:hypothetical protein